MIFLLLTTFLLSMLIGILLFLLLCPLQAKSRIDLLLITILGSGLGLGISSGMYFIYLLFFGTNQYYFIFEINLVIILLIIFLNRKQNRGLSINSYIKCRSDQHCKILLILPYCFWITLTLSIFSFLNQLILYPHGMGDPWAIWNLHARFLYRGGNNWKDGFTNIISWSHPDYPLLLSGYVARCWKWVGNDTVLVPAFVSMFFTYMTVGLVYSSISVFRTREQGYLAGLTLLCVPFFIEHGAQQYADIPIGFYFLATFVLFSFQERLSQKHPHFPIFTGIFSSLAAWTKNEGLLFLFVVLLVGFIVNLTTKNHASLKQTMWFIIGALPVLILLIYFKTQIAPRGDIFSAQSSQQIIDKLSTVKRYIEIITSYVKEILRFGKGYTFAVLVIYFLLLGINKDNKSNKTYLPYISIILFMLIGYFIIYLITPHDLKWHLDSSLNRLFIQLWPSFVFIFFLFTRRPDELLVRGK